jgi:small ligand-binding sensory domain FIST
VVRRNVEACLGELGGDPNCVFAFVSSDWRPHVEEFLEIVQVHGRAPLVVGCSADGVIGTGEEDEGVSGFTLMMLRLPNTKVGFASIKPEEIVPAPRADYWHRLTGVPPKDAGDWIVLCNPALVNAEKWLKGWNAAYPESRCFGGLASGGSREEDLFLFHSFDSAESAALVLNFRGGVRLDGVLSQGCRPIGEPYTITSVEENLVVRIASKSAFEILEETFESLAEEEQEMARGNILAGLAMTEYVEEHGRGDFLVRNIIGGDPDAGVLALGAFPRVGQTLQFQLRDKDAADEDMRRLCEAARAREGDAFASVLFTCTGRGARMFEVPNHDAGIVEEVFGKIPSAGFFCNGEIGPVGEKNFLHGYTASLALFVKK